MIIKRGKKVLINTNRKINIFKIKNILIFNDLKQTIFSFWKLTLLLIKTIDYLIVSSFPGYRRSFLHILLSFPYTLDILPAVDSSLSEKENVRFNENKKLFENIHFP